MNQAKELLRHVDLHSFEEFNGKGDSLLGANKISWARPAPLGDYLLGVYYKIFLESFEQKPFKKSQNF